MPIATIVALLGAVNTLLTIAKEFPEVIDEARTLLAKVAPYVETAGVGVATWYAQLRERVS